MLGKPSLVAGDNEIDIPSRAAGVCFPLLPCRGVLESKMPARQLQHVLAVFRVHLEPLEVGCPVGVRPCREDVDPKYWFVCVACSSNSCSNVLVKVLIFILRVVHAASGPLVFVCVPLGSKYLVPFVNAPVMCHPGIIVEGTCKTLFVNLHEVLQGMVDLRRGGPMILNFDGTCLVGAVADLCPIFVPAH